MPRLRILSTLVCALSAVSAHACTVCNSATGRQLRSGLFNGNFLHTLAIVSAPVPLLLSAILLVHHGMPDLAVSPSLNPSQREPAA